jgi:membrane protein
MIEPLTIKELARRTWREVMRQNALGRAAELAYFFLMALFPLLIFVLSFISFLPGAQQTIFEWLSQVMPGEALNIVDDWVEKVFSSRSGGLLSFGLLFALWAASTGMAALMGALNNAYDIAEGRPFWKKRLVALSLTIVLTLMVIGGAVLVTFGDRIASWLEGALGQEAASGKVSAAIRYAVGLAMLDLGIQTVYYFAPNVKQKWKWITPGALFAASAFVIVSILFSLYLRFAPGYDATYGSLGAVVVLMLWLYLMGLILYIGGQINAEIEKARGINPTEKEHEYEAEAGIQKPEARSQNIELQDR